MQSPSHVSFRKSGSGYGICRNLTTLAKGSEVVNDSHATLISTF